ncbi:MAG: ribosome biogenesis GTPase Der [Verrucomicrobiota bacterium]
MTGIIAIVGRPNVGKSALFNRIVGRRIAIVHDQPGVTRDRVIAEAEWHGNPFTLVDTGGIGLLRGEKTEDALTRAAFEQVQIAIDSANVILFVVNLKEGLVPLDIEVAARLRKSGKIILVAANKADSSEVDEKSVDFARLGFASVFPVSALHNRGLEPMLDAALAGLPKAEVTETPVIEGAAVSGAPVKLAIVGRPNVGKSSIINALTQSKRVIVSPIPGTTRDAIDVPFEVDTEGVRQKYILIDTAGMRKRNRVDDTVEFFSVQRAEESIARCDIVVLVLDAEMGVLEQDKKIGDIIMEQKKACVIVVNKWDLMEDDVRAAREKEDLRPQRGTREASSTLANFSEWVHKNLFFLDFAPVIFASAKSGFHLDRLLEAIRFVAAQLQQKVPTAILNRVVQDAIERRQPISDQGHFLKLFYATQTQVAPPTFLLFVNRKELFSPPYEKYLQNALRKAFGYEGCPVVLAPRARPKTIEPVRRKAGPDKPRQRR